MNNEELAQMKAGRKDGKGGGKGKGGKGGGKGSGKTSGKSTPGGPKPKKMLCFQFRDTGTCTVENCKYLHVDKEEYAKLMAFSNPNKGAKGGAAGADKDATGDKKKKKRKAKKGGGAAAAATDLAA
jgi:hypothetical protein